MTATLYRFAWGAKSFRFNGARKDHRCRLVARLPMNSALVEWEDGTRDVISRNALRRAALLTAAPATTKEG